jgi:hypothetical protein
MALLARQDCQEPVVRRLAGLYRSPILIDQFFRAVWSVVDDPEDAEFVRAPKLQAEQYFDSGFLEGDCDDASTLAACLLCALQIPNCITAIRRPRQADFSHVFTRAVDNGFLVDIDPIVPAYRMPIPESEIAERMEVFL